VAVVVLEREPVLRETSQPGDCSTEILIYAAPALGNSL